MKNIILTGFLCLFVACQSVKIRQFTLTCDVTLEPGPGSQTRVWILVPQNTPIQKISNLEIESDVSVELKSDDKYGNRYLYAQIDKALPVSTHT